MRMYRRKVIYGIVGCGVAARVHAEAILRNRESVLKAVFDINRERAQKFVEKYGCEIKSSLSRLLNDKEINAIIICTPHDIHAGLIFKTLSSRKYCITEKPLYLSHRDRIVVEKIASSKKMIVVFQVRFHEPMQFLLRSIKKGLLGKIRFCSITVRKKRDKNYFSDWHGNKARVGGMLLNQGMHALDLMLLICGNPREAWGLAKNIRKFSKIEDVFVGHVRFSNGALGNIEILTCGGDPRHEDSIFVAGTKGSMKVGGGIFERIEYADFGNGKLTPLLKKKDGNGHSKFLSAVNDYILRGKKHPLLPFADDGFRANRLARLLYKSAKNS